MNVKDQAAKLSLSVITPSYNQGQFIERTIESVLCQKVPVEFLVFDGGSTDETVSILEKYEDQLSWVSEKDGGQADAVNQGLRAASGDVVGWLNSDDIYYPGCFDAVLEFFEKNIDVDVVYGLANHIDIDDNVLNAYPTLPWDFKKLTKDNYLCQPAVFFRKKIVDEFGVLDDELHFCLDYEYWLRIGRLKPFYYLEQTLAGSRMYPENKTLSNPIKVLTEIFSVFQKYKFRIDGNWIFGHAHAVAYSEGLSPEGDRTGAFVARLITVSIKDFTRFKTFPSFDEWKRLLLWSGALTRVRINCFREFLHKSLK